MLVHYEAICNRFVDRRKRARFLGDHSTSLLGLVSEHYCDFDVRYCHAVSGSLFRLTPIPKLLVHIKLPRVVALFGGWSGLENGILDLDQAISLVDQYGDGLISVFPGVLAMECSDFGPKSWHVLVRDLPVVERALQTLKGKRPK